MNSESQNQIPLHKILEDNGWHNEDNLIYPPHGTFWISGSDRTPIFIIENMREKMKDSLQKTYESPHAYFDKQQFQNFVEDMESFINITGELINKTQKE